MKEATYTDLKGKKFTVSYNENSPCRICGLPVIEASVGGTDVCPWCDCGKYKDGSSWSFDELTNNELLRKRAKEVKEAQDEKSAGD